jgi:hypothetical protein
VVDELGTTYLRGIPQPITPDAVCLLGQAPFVSHFILSSVPLWLDRADNRWTAVYPAEAPCLWQGHFALFAGPFVEAADDDHHVYRRGEPVEVCSKTLAVLGADGYASHFAIINRAGQNVSGDAVTCSPNEACC